MPKPFENLIGAIFVLMGGLAMAILVKQGFDIPWSKMIGEILDAFEHRFARLLSPVSRFVETIASRLVFWTEIDIRLYPHWKHIFYIMWFYLGRDASLDLRRKRIGAAVFTFFWGGFVALMTSVVAGSQPLRSSDAGWVLLSAPIAAFIIFDTVRSIWRTFFQRHIRAADGVPEQSDWVSFKYYMNAVVKPFVIWGAITALILLAITTIGKDWNLRNPGLLLLFLFLVGNAFSFILRALNLAISDRMENEGFWARFKRSGSSKLGISMLQAFGVLLILLSVSVTLHLLGF